MRIPYTIQKHINHYLWLKEEKKRNFSFVHIPKTAGYSIENAFGMRLKHIRAVDLMNLHGENWKNRFSFSIVRNPYDRMVSLYLYLKHMGQLGLGQSDDPDFDTWVSEVLQNQNPRFWSDHQYQPCNWWVCDDEKNILVDFVGKMRDLKVVFNTIKEKVSMDDAQLPHLKRSIRGPFQTYYKDKKTYNLIKDFYFDDFKIFGYETQVG